MRLTILVSAALTVVAAGCKPPPPRTIEIAFKKEIQRYFNNLNEESRLRKDRLREEQIQSDRNPALQSPTGTIYNTYVWDETGFIVENFSCQVCGTRMLLPVPSAEYLCKSCRHCPYRMHPKGTNLKKTPCEICLQKKEGNPNVDVPRELIEAQTKQAITDKVPGAAVKDMFEITDTNKERGIMKATVRYIRRQYTFDEKATVQVPQKAVEKALVDPAFIPTGAISEDGKGRYDKYTGAGFHRIDATYVGEISFVFQGSEMELDSKKPAKEEPVRPWVDLGGRKN
jgi:hypothetical protein